MAPIDTVVFDLGNVMIPWEPRTIYRSLLPDEAAVDAFMRDVCPPTWHAQQDRGRSIEEALSERIALFPEHEALIRAYYEHWDRSLGEPIEGSVALMRELKDAGMRLYALTNWSHELFPHARQRFPFLAQFDGILVSGEEKMIKPEPQIYQRLFQRYAITPRTAVFIDDSLPNVEAARAQGMHAIHFQHPQQLRSALKTLGLAV